jgi:methyl-accepting chemotaxis protein
MALVGVAGALLLVAVALLLARSIGRAIRGLLGETAGLSAAVEQGNLSVRGHVEAVSPEFRPIVAGFNETMDAYARPIQVTRDYVDRISRGELPPKITTPTRATSTPSGSLNHLLDVVSGATGTSVRSRPPGASSRPGPTRRRTRVRTGSCSRG